MSHDLKARPPVLIQSLLGDLNHKIRSPLNTIINTTELVLRQDPDPPLRNHLRTIERSASGLLSLIDDIIALSEEESCAYFSSFCPISLLEEVREVIEIEGQARAIPLLALDLGEEMPRRLKGPRTILRYVLIQILDYLVSHLRARQILISLSWDKEERLVLQAKALVGQGNGVVTEEDLRSHHKLAICHSLLRHVGTELRFVTSAEGMSFVAPFPVEKVANEGGKIVAQEMDKEPPVILMVNSEGFSTGLIGRLLDMEGFPVRKEAHLEGALEYLQASSGQYSVACILNWQDVKDEKDLAIDILRSVPGHEQMPIVIVEIPAMAIMALASTETSRDLLGLLMKPTKSQEVLAELLRLLGWGHLSLKGQDVQENPFRQEQHIVEEKLRGLSVLIVEDDRINQQILLDILKAKGVKSIVASTGRAALKAIERKRFNAVLMDIGLPDRDGFSLTKDIRKSVLNSSTPVIALTASTSKEQKCYDAGMNAFLSKPYSQEKLLRTLCRLV